MLAIPTLSDKGKALTIKEAEAFNDKLLRDLVACQLLAAFAMAGSARSWEGDARAAFEGADAFMTTRKTLR